MSVGQQFAGRDRAVHDLRDGSNGGGAARVSFVPGCGITDVQTNDGASDFVLQSVGTDSALGQVTVPAGQPAIVAALHALWQHAFGVRPH